ncbi:MAG: CDP-alcohol phosphatidyltransferase family protein [Microbacteriaceae bacterium]|nr:CDP-alcohol phosphatidyltransferase family protein [Microbacteriaceae bacterium]
MGKVQIVPWFWVPGALGLLAIVNLVVPLTIWGWVTGLCYFAVSTTLLSRGLRHRRAMRFGPANVVTATRSALVGVVCALVVTSFPAPPVLATAIVVPTLLLDAVDGWVARRTASETPLGARFDMEVDAFLLFVLSVAVAPTVGWWAIAIGLMRYAFVAAGWVLPWMRAQLPPRYWRKIVTAVCGISLVVALSRLAPLPVSIAVVAIGLVLLIESFGRDVLWLARHRIGTEPARSTVETNAGYDSQTKVR